MFYLNKVVGAITNPLLLVILSATVGVLIALRGRRRLGFALIGCAVVWLWLCATPIMTLLVGVPLECEFLDQGRVPKVETFPAADAIVLLGGGDANFSPYGEMSARADRVWQAARLCRSGKSSKIISTGISPQAATLPLLMDFGVAKDVALFFEARNTEEEAKVVGRLGCTRILLVTSAWHMKRARLMFEKYAPDIEVICAPADFENIYNVKRRSIVDMLMPDINTLGLNTATMHEWIGIGGYKVFR